MASLLIKDALLVGGQPAGEPFYGWVAVEGDRIVALGAGAPAPGAHDRVIDAGGAPVLPGLVNTHAHSHSTLTRGTAENLPLEQWLPRIFREMRRLTDDIAVTAALMTYAEALLSGTTCMMDMCVNPEAAARAAAMIGIRVVIAPYVGDQLRTAPDLARTAALIGRLNGKGGKVEIWVGLHEAESSSESQVNEAVALAQRAGTGLHTHCSETRAAEQATQARAGCSQLAYFHRLGAIGPRSVLAHGVWLTAEDQEIVARSGAHIAHCPQSNLKLGSGIAPVPALRSRGINVSLGTDGAKANNCLDMFDVMKFASLLPKGVDRNPATLPAGEVLGMATIDGGRALGLPIGVIAPGLKADLVVLKPDRIHLQPVLPQTVVTNLVHAARGADVDTVVVDGRIVVESGRLMALDGGRLVEEARRAAEILMAE